VGKIGFQKVRTLQTSFKKNGNRCSTSYLPTLHNIVSLTIPKDLCHKRSATCSIRKLIKDLVIIIEREKTKWTVTVTKSRPKFIGIYASFDYVHLVWLSKKLHLSLRSQNIRDGFSWELRFFDPSSVIIIARTDILFSAELWILYTKTQKKSKVRINNNFFFVKSSNSKQLRHKMTDYFT
jgi:hypothetical protein